MRRVLRDPGGALGPDGPRVLEVNAIPGLTDTSLFPMAAEAAGIAKIIFVVALILALVSFVAGRRPAV